MSAFASPLNILHPTDFSPGSEMAFLHALRIALENQASLSLLHVSESGRDESFEHFPHVRDALVRWGRIAPGSSHDAVVDLGLDVRKVNASAGSVVDAIQRYARATSQEPDLIVLSTAGRQGLPRWWQPSIAERIARDVRLPTLFVPQGSRGWIGLDDDAIHLNNVLIPIDASPPPDAALWFGRGLLEHLNVNDPTITLLHSGEEKDFAPHVPKNDDVAQHRLLYTVEEPVKATLDVAEQLYAELIIMVTHGHDGMLDALRGSTTERVLRNAPCPLLTVALHPN